MRLLKGIAVAKDIYELSDILAEFVVIAKRNYPDKICEILVKKLHNSLWLVNLIVNWR